ncbi:MAG: DHH family phosphoesterase [Planctomycetes bacterium]|nr:DHH family phosphoesterase [Planctomycetota bacterium]
MPRPSSTTPRPSRRSERPGRGASRPPADALWRRGLEMLRVARRVVITTHVDPDGDALGSELALARFLCRGGREVRVMNATAHPPEYDFLTRRGEVRVFDPAAAADRDFLNTCDLVVILDVSRYGRLAGMEEAVRRAPAPKVCIDHHVDEGEKFDLRLADERACATAALVLRVIDALGGALDLRLAEPLLAAIVADTGSFRFQSTDGEAFAAAARLVAAGAEPHALYRRVDCARPIARVRMLGRNLRALRLAAGGRVAWLRVSRRDAARQGCDVKEVYDIIPHLTRVAGVEVGVCVVEHGPGEVRVSLRSAGRVNVHALAQRMGGGGHRMAAGFSAFKQSGRAVARRIVAAACVAAATAARG